jgi:hypothetical protein
MIYKEDNLQMAVARYLDLLGVVWCHVANERKVSLRAGARLKKKGVKSGVPDCLVFEPSKQYVGLALELKIKPNRATLNQKQWLDALRERKWRTELAYDFDEAMEIIDNYLKTEKL